MRKNNVVSIWCGYFSSEEELFDYVEIDYADEDNPASQWMRDSNLDWYDEDYAEASFEEVRMLVEGVREHSCGETFPTQLDIDLKNHVECNALYLIYDYDASDYQQMKSKLHLLGVYSYLPDES